MIPRWAVLLWLSSAIIGAGTQTWCAYTLIEMQNDFLFSQGVEIHD